METLPGQDYGNDNDTIQYEMGPHSNYLPYNRIAKVTMKTRHWIVAISLISIYSAYILNKYDIVDPVLRDLETEFFNLLVLQKSGQFFLSFRPFLALQLYSILPLSIGLLRLFSLCLSSLTLLLVFSTLILSRVNMILSSFGMLSIMSLSIFQINSVSVNENALCWFTLVSVIHLWQNYRLTGKGKFKTMLLISVLLGSNMSIKYSGFMTLLWAMVVFNWHLWNRIIPDLGCSNKNIAKLSITHSLLLLIIPLSIFLLTSFIQITHWKFDNPEYSKFMSSYFQTYLRNNKRPITLDSRLYYGSVIELRHLNSIGGYLASVNATYPSGSQEQIVGITSQEDSEWNHFILEPIETHVRNEVQEGKIVPVKQSRPLKLRHKLTGKLLRASDVRPPISEHDYDKEVSCTGDISYNGKNDEFWKFDVTTLDEKRPVRPLEDTIQVRNIGQRCTLMSHDIKLPEVWNIDLSEVDNYLQEVICIESAVHARSLFQVILVRNAHSEPYEKFFYPSENESFKFSKLFYEIVVKQFKSDSYIGKSGTEEVDYIEVGNWPFKTLDDNIYVKHIWLSSIVSIMLVIFGNLITIVSWNPFSKLSKAETTKIYKIIFTDVSIECLVGWFLHYYVFMKWSNSEGLDVTNYFPSFLFGELLFIYLLNYFYHWNKMSLIIVPIYLLVMLYMNK
ncbi:hypothetical protein KAFR_0B00800 [Kazachstania africana CBS 2517]|uniref:dolichyl-phosphate-mannose--protein mannosyltransferase n=1 Tax=Kazachstania africana (strain ATCC 22294 / BCRC 22015 / CBS 2517 / CECT 1963 / NBRC 1671 / NRRL Y-8276) TaxID=1071382 RepID=H2APS8_KAZAF|nr:hypothetical protein KAFR_0B00800 [Kazachstania africana CBS 2517]CCF56378.1 hypothetical protein KAFR_0B00800 [Kazachstania africana CBS 2517]